MVGSGVNRVRISTFDLDGSGYLVLASDGLGISSDVSELYNSSFERGGTLAEACLERWNTGKDDASILIYRFIE